MKLFSLGFLFLAVGCFADEEFTLVDDLGTVNRFAPKLFAVTKTVVAESNKPTVVTEVRDFDEEYYPPQVVTYAPPRAPPPPPVVTYAPPVVTYGPPRAPPPPPPPPPVVVTYAPPRPVYGEPPVFVPAPAPAFVPVFAPAPVETTSGGFHSGPPKFELIVNDHGLGDSGPLDPGSQEYVSPDGVPVSIHIHHDHFNNK